MQLLITMLIVLIVGLCGGLCYLLKDHIKKCAALKAKTVEVVGLEQVIDGLNDELLNARAIIDGLQRKDNEPEAHLIQREKSRHVASPSAYESIFVYDPRGQAILTDLIHRFARNTYVQGGHDAERQTCFNQGQYHVINHINSMINRASDPNYLKSEDESHV